MKQLLAEYKKKKPAIKKRLKEFSKIQRKEDVFSELCFCVLTPQSKAVNCDKAIKSLQKGKLLLTGSKKSIVKRLKTLVRFHNNKAEYILQARKSFSDIGNIKTRSILNKKDVFKIREWLAKNVKGISYKEASHFLRNIGLGRDIAIIDRHILYCLKRYGVIKQIPKTINRESYLQIESKMSRFAKRISIPLGELDLLFWSRETGFIFK